MGGHGSSSGLAKRGTSGSLSEKELAEVKEQIDYITSELHNGKMSLEEYHLLKHTLQDTYGIDGKTLVAIKNGTYGEQTPEQQKTRRIEPSSPDLAGLGRNPWPPDASSSHLSWETSEDIRTMMNGNVSESASKRMYSAIASFTGDEYSDIREAQASGEKYTTYGRKGVMLERFIKAGVKSGHEWNAGTTYRGIFVNSGVFRQILDTPVGQKVDPNFGGSASWSTKRAKAESFAGHGASGHSVVFVTNGNKHSNAVSIQNLSTYWSEYEVLASSGNQYTKTGQFSQNGTLYVFVDVS